LEESTVSILHAGSLSRKDQQAVHIFECGSIQPSIRRDFQRGFPDTMQSSSLLAIFRSRKSTFFVDSDACEIHPVNDSIVAVRGHVLLVVHDLE
jgi:hypothetical protein